MPAPGRKTEERANLKVIYNEVYHTLLRLDNQAIEQAFQPAHSHLHTPSHFQNNTASGPISELIFGHNLLAFHESHWTARAFHQPYIPGRIDISIP